MKTYSALTAVLVVAAVFTAGVGFGAKPATATVSDESVCLVPAKPLTGVNAWAATRFYKQGTVVVSVRRYYMAVADGTSGGTKPVHTSGEVSDGGVAWRWIDKDERNGIVVVLESDGKVNWSLSPYAAEAGKGVSTSGIGSGFEFGPEYQGAIYVISSNTNTVTVGIQEW